MMMMIDDADGNNALVVQLHFQLQGIVILIINVFYSPLMVEKT